MVKTFYSVGGLNAETYDARTLGFPGELDFWVARAQESGGPVLELACGTGRVSWPIARAGIDIVGIDVSRAMLEQAQAKRASEVAEVGARARFLLGDMANFSLAERFSLTIIPFRAFQSLLTVEAQRSSLGCIHHHLKPGGRLIIDIFDPRLDLLLEDRFVPLRQIAPYRNPHTDLRVTVSVVERTNDRLRQLLTEQWRFCEMADEGRVVREEDELLELRWTYRYEMRHLLELCNFVIEEELSDFRGGAPAYGLEQIVIARRVDTEAPRP